MDKIFGLVYVSDALIHFSKEDLEELAGKAAANNEKLDVTGYLYYEHEHFVQYLEGTRERVEALMKRIEQDPRHTVLHVITTEEIGDRKFPNWHMQWLTRPVLITIRMENLLADYLRMLKNDSVFRSQQSEAIVWEMVDRISHFRTLLV